MLQLLDAALRFVGDELTAAEVQVRMSRCLLVLDEDVTVFVGA